MLTVTVRLVDGMLCTDEGKDEGDLARGSAVLSMCLHLIDLLLRRGDAIRSKNGRSIQPT